MLQLILRYSTFYLISLFDPNKNIFDDNLVIDYLIKMMFSKFGCNSTKLILFIVIIAQFSVVKVIFGQTYEASQCFIKTLKNIPKYN